MAGTGDMREISEDELYSMTTEEFLARLEANFLCPYNDGVECPYNDGVECSQRIGCDRCGWNPEVAEARKKSLRERSWLRYVSVWQYRGKERGKR